jgi:AcrR family transcriptional regulator
VAVSGQLPRGRHGIPREEVVRAQRERLVRAMAVVMAEKGYAAATVADVIAEARVSRETFYQQFASKQECFLAAYDAAAAAILSGIPAAEGERDRLAAFERGLAAYLGALAAEPAFARLFLVEVFAAGPQAIERRMRAQAAFARVLCDLFDARDEDARFAVDALVAAVGSMVTARVASGDAAGLTALHEPVATLVRRALDS